VTCYAMVRDTMSAWQGHRTLQKVISRSLALLPPALMPQTLFDLIVAAPWAAANVPVGNQQSFSVSFVAASRRLHSACRVPCMVPLLWCCSVHSL
jgi:hypothetical protein